MKKEWREDRHEIKPRYVKPIEFLSGQEKRRNKRKKIR